MPSNPEPNSPDLHRLKAFSKDVFNSRAYLYPFKGIYHLTTHAPLRTPLLSRVWPTATIGIGVTTTMFLFTYLPQTFLLSFTSGPFAPISAIFLVLSESSSITNVIARWFLLRDALVDTFDATLVLEGALDALVRRGREGGTSGSTSGSGEKEGEEDLIGKLGRIRKPQRRGEGGELDVHHHHTRQALMRSLVYLPLNLVPVVGTLLYLGVQGGRMGRIVHERYFQLKGWDGKRRGEWVSRLWGGYWSFGTVAAALEMVPFASLVFAFTNTVGGALWAIDLEKAVQ